MTVGTYPDANADQGYHHARYSILPHAGSWQEANFTLGFDLAGVEEVDMLEEKVYERISLEGRHFSSSFGLFEIKTFKIRRA